MVTTLVPAVAVNRLFSLALSYLGVRMVTIEAQALFVNKLLHQAITAHIKTQLALALINNNYQYSNNSYKTRLPH